MLEGQALQDAHGRPYDWQRNITSKRVLAPLLGLQGRIILSNIAALGKAAEHAEFLHGSIDIRGAIRVIWLDNSNYQVLPQQLDFFEGELTREPRRPVVLLVHVPFFAGGDDPRGPTDTCGHPEWGSGRDRNADVED